MNGPYNLSQQLSSIHSVPDLTLLRFTPVDPFTYPIFLSSYNNEAFLNVLLAATVPLPHDAAMRGANDIAAFHIKYIEQTILSPLSSLFV